MFTTWNEVRYEYPVYRVPYANDAGTIDAIGAPMTVRRRRNGFRRLARDVGVEHDAAGEHAAEAFGGVERHVEVGALAGRD